MIHVYVGSRFAIIVFLQYCMLSFLIQVLPEFEN